MDKNCGNCKMSFTGEHPDYVNGSVGSTEVLVCGNKNSKMYCVEVCDIEGCCSWVDPRKNSTRFIQDE